MRALPLLLVILAIVFVIVAVLYALGVLQIAVSDPGSPHHYTHAILFAVLAVVSLIAANFVRRRPV